MRHFNCLQVRCNIMLRVLDQMSWCVYFGARAVRLGVLDQMSWCVYFGARVVMVYIIVSVIGYKL